MESPVPEPDPLFDAIGRVAVAWSLLESELGQLLTALLHTPMAGVLSVGQSYEVIHSHIGPSSSYRRLWSNTTCPGNGSPQTCASASLRSSTRLTS